MTTFHGDILFPDVDPAVLAAAYTSGEIARGLTSLAELAREMGFEQVWEDVELCGLDRSLYAGGPPRTGQLGVSLSWAHLPGIGFYREDEYVAEVPDIDPGLSPIQQALLRKNEARLREQASVRGPQVEAVRRLCEAARGRLPFPVAAAIGFESSWVHDFRAAYLRRLAYGLGYEASLRAGSLQPYEAHYRILVAGTPGDVAAALPAVDDPLSFSVWLNLLGVLDRISAYERDHEGAAPGLSGRVVESEAKRAVLSGGLERAAEIRGRTLHDEGRLVLQALLDESRRLATKSTWFDGSLPSWSDARVPDPGRTYSD